MIKTGANRAEPSRETPRSHQDGTGFLDVLLKNLRIVLFFAKIISENQRLKCLEQ
jgi:hypothetical protein